jgi:hypothetical protein
MVRGRKIRREGVTGIKRVRRRMGERGEGSMQTASERCGIV